MHGNRLGTVEIVDILRQVTTALQYIASLHIAHRDIKPENILVVRRDESTVQLADFGWSIRMESKDAWCYTAMAGTAEYVPPECLKVSQPYQGQFVDRWALGLLAYELTQRESYFGGDDILKSIDAFKRLNADCFDECNEEKLIDFCRKLVRRKPNRRMTFEDALEHPFLSPAPPTLKRSGSCGMEAPVKRTRITTPLVVPLGETFL